MDAAALCEVQVSAGFAAGGAAVAAGIYAPACVTTAAAFETAGLEAPPAPWFPNLLA